MSQSMPPPLEPPSLEEEVEVAQTPTPPSQVSNALQPIASTKQEAAVATDNPSKTDDTPSLRDEMLKVAQRAHAAKEAEVRKQKKKKEEKFGQGLGEQMRRNIAKREANQTKAVQAKSDGNDAFKAQDWETAVAQYTTAIELDGANSILYSNRAAAYLKLKQYEEALLDGRRTMQLDPLLPKGYLRTATSLVRLGRSGQASACLRGAVSEQRGLTKANRRALEKQWKMLVPNDYEKFSKEKEMPTLKGSGELTGTTVDDTKAPQILDEEAMKRLAEDSSAWANENLTKKLMANPNVAKAFTDPRFAGVLETMQTDPQSVFANAKDDPDLGAILSDLLKILGEHFNEMGDDSDNAKKNIEYKEGVASNSAASKNPTLVEEVHMMSQQEVKEKKQVDSVLANEQLREILEDPDTKEVLKLCGKTDMLGRYMRHEKWGPRLRLLGQHGLVKFEK